jgi:hypothetical protein
VRKPYRPRFEQLEDRLTPASLGGSWLDAQHLSLSFVPDGTMATTAPSNLFQALNATMPGQNWEQVIVQAIQTWAVNGSINVHVVNDSGQPLGSPGLIQGDPRFGDIRIAGQDLGPSVISIGTGFSVNGNRWSGTVVFNTSDQLGIGTANAYDLFTVALHEAGHVFGLPDTASDPTSVMYNQYTGPRSGLSPADVANFQAINGTRRPDSFQNGAGNHSFQTAASLDNNHLSVVADIGAVGQTEFYQFQYGGPLVVPGASVTIQVQTSGLSLLEPNLTVYDNNHNVVGSASSINPLNGNVSVQISSPVNGMHYFIQVGTSTQSVFGVGGYQLNIIPQGYQSLQNVINLDDNHLTITAAAGSVSQTSNFKFQYDGHVGIPGAPVTIQVQSISLMLPTLTVYDSSYNVVGSTTSLNSSTLAVQINNPVLGMNYYVAVGTSAVTAFDLGSYTLSIIPQGSQAAAFNPILGDPHQQHQLQSPESLSPNANGLGLAFYDQGGISSSALGDYYKVHTPNTPNNVPEQMVVMAWGLGGNALTPQVQVYDNHANAVPAQVIGNGNGFFSVNIPNAVPGQDYVVEVSALSSGSLGTTGNYAVGVEFNSNSCVDLSTVAAGQLTAALPQQVETLQVNQSGGIAFLLAAQSATAQGNTQVQMTIYDANGNVVYSLDAGAGQQVSGSVYLLSGTYTISFTAVANSPNSSWNVTYNLEADLLSEPIGPLAVQNGTASTSTTTRPPTTTIVLAPVVVGTAPIYY